ncbi:MAG: hypothetical protein O2955_02325 [Planctomycetota bacterium]|nr:hypothetical protein [Planctomycetota bacterium]MDA1211320.1 hypothetical protein [Planctomycetota bacterium]
MIQRMICIPMLSSAILFFISTISLVCYAEEVLYNGIKLPEQWPPRPESFSRDPQPEPPYLSDPPKVISIDVGRQLFVDDFLIDSTTLKREYHQPEWYEGNPIFKAEERWEFHNDRNIPFAAPFSDGVWFDPQDRTFKMWYMGGSNLYFCLATSDDGIHWKRPALGEKENYPESNILKIEPIERDLSSIIIDLDDLDPAKRYKMFYYRSGLQTRFSPDGIHWSDIVAMQKEVGDRTTVFYNPFRKLWIYSVRSGQNPVGRCRYYGESRDVSKNSWENLNDISRWTSADSLDRVQPVEFKEKLPDLYNLDATAYESLLVGFFTIHSHISEGDRPKINHVTLGYSRDGHHWHRPDRRPFLNVSDDNQAWNYGNVQPAGGGCLVMGDQLYFYCSGRNSHKPEDDGTGGSTGLATLRRDGFASLSADAKGGTLITHPVRFGGKHLYVNIDDPAGELRVDILDENGKVIPAFSKAKCKPVSVDSTKTAITWKETLSLEQLEGKPVRFRFSLKNGKLYSFWVSPDPNGASQGYVAAGGPEYTSFKDEGN